MDNEATDAATQPGGSQVHNHDTDELLDPVLFSNDNGSYKLNTVPAFRYVLFHAHKHVYTHEMLPVAMNHQTECERVMLLLISQAKRNKTPLTHTSK